MRFHAIRCDTVIDMEKILSVTTLWSDDSTQAALAYWLSRPPDERIAEVERLRREYVERIRGSADASSQRLSRVLTVVERPRR